jgi:anaerobic magnesium-protoporphyrin IX monomethyl ester cyclase
MKILLAHGYYLANDLNERKFMKPYPPLGLLYISSALKKAGHTVQVFDSTFRSPADYRNELAGFEPELVGLYANIITREAVLEMLGVTRELGYPAIVGGPDPTGDGDAYLQAGILAVVRGEGEQTATELVGHLERNGMDSDSSAIPGLFLLRNGSTVDTGARERVSTLDELDHPDRGAIDLNQYLEAWRNHHGYSSVNLITTRGCPYHCTWCSREIFGNGVRQRSTENVLEELEMITAEYQPEQIWFSDDVLTLNKKWTLELTSEMKKRGLTTRFECLSRVDRVDAEILQGLKDAGCFRVWYGAESGSEKMVKAMGKGFTVEQVKESVALTMKTGIEVGLFILIGYPGETVFDLLKTMGMIRELKPDYCGGSVAFPIKGTPFYDDVRHLLSEDYAWSRRNENRLSFRGRYPRLFYWFAVRLLHNWSSFFSVRSRTLPIWKRFVYGLKFIVAGAGTIGIGIPYWAMQKILPERS